MRSHGNTDGSVKVEVISARRLVSLGEVRDVQLRQLKLVGSTYWLIRRSATRQRDNHRVSLRHGLNLYIVEYCSQHKIIPYNDIFANIKSHCSISQRDGYFINRPFLLKPL